MTRNMIKTFLEVIVFLIPTTLLYLFMLMVLIKDGFQMNWELVSLIVLPAYAMSCLFWLSFSWRSIEFNSIYTKIYIGIIIGNIYALFLSYKFGVNRSDYNSILEAFAFIWALGFGPMLYSWYLLYKVWGKGKDITSTVV